MPILPNDVHAPRPTQLTQRVGKSGVMPPVLPGDVHAPAKTYHMPTSSPGENVPSYKAQPGGPDGSYVPDLFVGSTVTEPAEGGGEHATPTVNIPAPVQGNPSTATTGGTLAAATYFYKVTATNDEGETTPSNEKSQATTGTTSTVTLNWTESDASATGYKVYRGTSAGAENKLVATLPKGTTTWTDTGVVGTTATLPGANTTVPKTFTRTNVTKGAARNPFPKDPRTPTTTRPNPPKGGSNTPSWGGEAGGPSSG